MTRAQAIDRITARLPSLDDDAIRAVAEIAESFTETESVLPRKLAPHELALIEQSKADFREGRTLLPQEASSYIDAGLERRRQQRARP